MVDILTKTSANEATMKQEEMDEEFEDGELVEEGELRSDDEEEKPGLLKPASPGSQGSPPNGHAAASPRDKKPSREELVAPAPSKSAVRESLWSINAKPPQQPQHHQPQSHHDEGFGFADRDFRSMGSGAGGEDRDFRWAEGPANGGGSDSDYDFRDRRRRHSPSPPPHLKRARPSPPRPSVFDDEGPPFMGGRGGHFGGRGGFRGRGRGGGFGAPRWMERHICKFFREGYCRDGDNCSYSHNAEDSKRRPEVCKFYYTGHCKKGLACHHLHGEFPCKAFHKGECTREPCQFSHLPLTDYTRPLFEATMREEQYNMRQQTLPQGPPVRRRVLLPGGPVPGAPTPLVPANPAAVAAAQAAAAIVTQGLVAPPGVTPGPFPPGYVPTGAAAAAATAAAGAAGEGVAAPAASLPPPSVVVPRLSTPQMQHQVKQEEPAAPPVSTASAVAASAAADANGGFNISMMLAQIAGSQLPDATSSNPSSPPLIHVKQEELDSPESPPAAVGAHFGTEWGAAGPSGAAAPMSYPGGSTATASPAPVVYRLRPVDHEAPYCGVSSAVISTESQQSDPRIARLLASQFDAVSSMIAAQQAAAAAAAAAAPPAQPAAPAPAPSRDPRARADPRSRDPRQREPEQSRVSWMPQMS